MKTKKKLTVSTLLIIFCSLSLLATTYAWVTMNRHLDSKNQQIQIESQGMTIESYIVYQYIDEENAVKRVDTSSGQFTMTSYDSIFPERNKNTPLLFEIHLRDITDDNVQLIAYCDPDHPYVSSNSDADNYTSNIVSISATVSDSVDIADLESLKTTDLNQFYEKLVSWFKDEANNSKCAQNQFLVNEGGNQTKYDEIDFELDLPVGHGTTTTLYLILDYNDDLITLQDIRSFGNIDISSEYKSIVQFENDLRKIVIY